MSIQEEEWSSGPPPAHWRWTHSGSVGLYLSVLNRCPLCSLCGDPMSRSAGLNELHAQWRLMQMALFFQWNGLSLSRAFPRMPENMLCTWVYSMTVWWPIRSLTYSQKQSHHSVLLLTVLRLQTIRRLFSADRVAYPSFFSVRTLMLLIHVKFICCTSFHLIHQLSHHFPFDIKELSQRSWYDRVVC